MGIDITCPHTEVQKLVAEYVGFLETNEHEPTNIAQWLNRFLNADRKELWACSARAPDKSIVAFRGVSSLKVQRNKYKNGLSWSCSLDVACWFATRRKQAGVIFVAEIWMKDIFCLVGDVGEREVIAYPSEFYQLKISAKEMRRMAIRYNLVNNEE